MYNYFNHFLNPPAYVQEIKTYERENETQTQNYNLAVKNLLSANICHNVGLYDDSCNDSARAIEKFLKSCPDINSTTEHKLDSLLDQFSNLTGYIIDDTKKKSIKNNFYHRQYGDNYTAATQEDSFKNLQLACEIKQEIDTYRETPIEEIFKFLGQNKPTNSITDEYIRSNQFDAMRAYSEKLTTNEKVNL